MVFWTSVYYLCNATNDNVLRIMSEWVLRLRMGSTSQEKDLKAEYPIYFRISPLL